MGFRVAASPGAGTGILASQLPLRHFSPLVFSRYHASHTCLAYLALCPKKLALHHFMIDFATVLNQDINSKDLSTAAFSCLALSLPCTDFQPMCRQ